MTGTRKAVKVRFKRVEIVETTYEVEIPDCDNLDTDDPEAVYYEVGTQGLSKCKVVSIDDTTPAYLSQISLKDTNLFYDNEGRFVEELYD